MKQIIVTSILSLSLATVTMAQEKRWTMDECMHYAVENSPKVKKQTHTRDFCQQKGKERAKPDKTLFINKL